MKQVAAAFVKAKRAFQPALKQSENPHFRTMYAGLGNCLDAVNEALLENGIALIQETSEDESGVTIETVFLHESGEILKGGKLHVPAAKKDPQSFGSALTYARRYSLMTACGISSEDDDGNAASQPQQQQQGKAMKVNPAAAGPKDRAKNITAGVENGDTEAAAKAMAGWSEPELNTVWAHLDAATQDKLTAAWPK
jgi:hypothetical protein